MDGHSEEAAREPQGARAARWLIAVGVIGMLCRLALAACSEGTNDTGAWARFAKEVADNGVCSTYRNDLRFNHPPLAGYWAMAAAQLARRTGLRFSFVFKLPVIAADCGSAILLYAVWRRAGPARGAAALALYAWSLDAILVSGYHCNTDPIYAFACLLSVWLIEDRRKDFWGGAALAAAINVKLIPVLLVAPLALRYRDAGGRNRLARFLLGLSTGVIPFIAVILNAWGSFKRNSLEYNGSMSGWGISFVLQKIGTISIPGMLGTRFDPRAVYLVEGRYLLFALVLSLAVLGRRRRWDRYTLAAATALLFLVIGPGFGVQYTSFAGALLLAANLRLGALYGIVTGVFLGAIYWGFRTGSFPLSSNFTGDFPNPVRPFRMAVWGFIIYLLVCLIRTARPLLDRAPV